MDFYKAYDLDDRWAIAFTRDFDRPEPVVYFLDKKYKHTNVCGIECQITCGAYYASTILGHKDGYDLCLDGDIPAWTVPAETVALAKKYCQEELQGGEGINNSRKAIKSSSDNQRYDYNFFRNKLKDSPYFEEYVVRYDDDAGEDNIHTKTDIPVTITYPDGKVKDYSNCWVQFYGSGWRFVINRGWSGKEKYSDIENVSVTPNSITIKDKEGWVIDFLINNGVKSSCSIKSSREESLALAFDRAEYCCKAIFGSEEGGRYQKWYGYGVSYGQDYAFFKVEHTDYSVRLSFEFMDTGFIYVDAYFTNGSSYDSKTIKNWNFEREVEDETAAGIKEVLDSFFDEGINILRGEEY